MRKLAHSLNYHPTVGEKNHLPTNTVPDQSISIYEMVERALRGQPFPQKSNEVYFEDLIIPHPNSVDMTDIDEQRRTVVNKRAQILTEINMNKQAKIDAESIKNTPPATIDNQLSITDEIDKTNT